MPSAQIPPSRSARRGSTRGRRGFARAARVSGHLLEPTQQERLLLGVVRRRFGRGGVGGRAWLGPRRGVGIRQHARRDAPGRELADEARGPGRGRLPLRAQALDAHDERIDRVGLVSLKDEEKTASRAEWAKAFGVTLKKRTEWPVEAADIDALHARVDASGALSELSVVEMLSLLMPAAPGPAARPLALLALLLLSLLSPCFQCLYALSPHALPNPR